MRIVGGTARGRKLVTPVGRTTRPTSERVRESIFDLLIPWGLPTGARVLDLFAGSGALGLEAASRGAAEVVAVDMDRSAGEAIRKNLEAMPTLRSVVRAVRSDVGTFVTRMDQDQVWDLVLADPPYAFGGWEQLLVNLASHARICVAESAALVEAAPGWNTVRQRRYGSTFITILRSQAAPGIGEEQPGAVSSLTSHVVPSALPEPGDLD